MPIIRGIRSFHHADGNRGRSAPATAGCIAGARSDRDDPASPLFASSTENETGGCRQKIALNNDCPIFACSFSTSWSEIWGAAGETPPNDDAMFSIAVRFQPLIIVGWMSYFLASSAAVSSSRIAYNATFALNSAE